MVDKKDLRNGVAVMRLVAQLLSEWADDMERAQGAGRKKKTAGPIPAAEEVPVPALVPEKAVAETEDSPVASSAPAMPLDSAHVLALLTEKCAAGFGMQVQALINSFGAGKFSELDPGHYAELVSAVGALGVEGEALTTASGGNLVRAEVHRNERAPQCGVAKIEGAE